MSAETLSASLEDYLEAIYHLIAGKQAARVKDISKRLKVNSSSVTGALKALAERKLVSYAPYELVTVAAAGVAPPMIALSTVPPFMSADHYHCQLPSNAETRAFICSRSDLSSSICWACSAFSALSPSMCACCS